MCNNPKLTMASLKVKKKKKIDLAQKELKILISILFCFLV